MVTPPAHSLVKVRWEGGLKFPAQEPGHSAHSSHEERLQYLFTRADTYYKQEGALEHIGWQLGDQFRGWKTQLSGTVRYCCPPHFHLKHKLTSFGNNASHVTYTGLPALHIRAVAET